MIYFIIFAYSSSLCLKSHYFHNSFSYFIFTIIIMTYLIRMVGTRRVINNINIIIVNVMNDDVISRV